MPDVPLSYQDILDIRGALEVARIQYLQDARLFRNADGLDLRMADHFDRQAERAAELYARLEVLS